ncbi:MAG: PBP1A family penicillin-binding protein [Candidatus Dependentiae bacterium]|nr:PBP1A family penicillin-binding protein [Candidatus Dependentiae bacterium]
MYLQSVAKKLFFTAILFFACLAGAFVFVIHSRCVDFSVLENYNPGQPSILLDDSGKEWGRFQLDRRKFVSLDVMPQSLINAFLATEDHKFYDHHGLSIRGICRSAFVNLYHGKKVQGASTITQQLVRLLFFDAKKTFVRKVKEQLFSLLVEFQFTKDQILETYLNHVYFGHGIYGVQAAAKRFWNKDVQDLALDEVAILAAMVRSPTHYSPISSPQNSQKRRNIVLRLMERRGYIDDATCLQAQSVPLHIETPEVDLIAPHLKETIRIFLEDYVGKQQLYSGGLIIQTTINYEIQKAAQKSFHDHVSNLKETLSQGIDGGLLSIATATGEIKALVGGYDFAKSKFNRAMQAKRQMGSIFKPFVYAVALEQGASLCDTEIDEPIEIKQGNQIWTPQNNTRKFIGQSTLARALSYSNNTIAVKTLLKVGIENVIAMARRAHINSEIHPYPSLALGCIDVSLDQAVGAFNIFANNGVYVQPHYLRWVKDKLGVKIYKVESFKEQVMDSKISSQILKVLGLGMNRLRSTIGEQWFGGDAAGKTGTTNDSRTCWFCGSTPDLTTGIYIGEDSNQSLGQKIYGARVAFPIWFALSKQITKNNKHFYYDPSLQEVTVDGKTGCISYDKYNPERIALLIS